MTEQIRPRKRWGTCDDCGISVQWSMHPDWGKDATLPDDDELTFFDCPKCGAIIHDGDD